MTPFILFTLGLSLTLNASEPKRIVSLSPTATEILFEMGVGALVVGTAEASDYPPEARGIERVGPYHQPNKEKLVRLKPDLVIIFREGMDQIRPFLRRARIQFLELEGRRLGDYENLVATLGKTLGREEKATRMIGEWKKEWSRIEQPREKKGAALVLETNPLTLAGRETFLSDIIERCGHRNAFANFGGYPQVSRERFLIQKGLDLIVLISADQLQGRTIFEQIKKPTIKVSPSDFSILGPRLPSLARDLCQKIRAAT